MVDHERSRIEVLRAEIGEISQHVGVDILEYRRIVHTVQKGEKEGALTDEAFDAGLALLADQAFIELGVAGISVWGQKPA